MSYLAVGALLREVIAFGPTVIELVRTLRGGKGEKENIDKIQNDLMEKITEQQIKLAEAVTAINKRLIYNAMFSGVSLIIGLVALILAINK